MPDMILYILLGISAAVIAVLCARLISFRRSLRSVCEQLEARLAEDSGAPIGCDARDRYLLRMTERLNAALATLAERRAQYLSGDAEVKNAVTNISHDLRTPLTAIAGYTELMKKEPLSERQTAYLERIAERARAMTALTEELFRYSMVISNGEEQKSEPVDLCAVLESCIADQYEKLKLKGIEPLVELPEGPVIRELDRDALTRVFGNILNNAVKYSEGDLSIVLTEDGNVSFANAASELTPVETAKLFDRFYTVGTGRNSTGLGLSIAKTLTERMGGGIGAELTDGVLTVWCKF
ncbi:MAG: HAMP domain-containing histidine kinase [Clostridia bacterium]|nr:HAMP domain-containing histidine kinase [Clostridia bacterium]